MLHRRFNYVLMASLVITQPHIKGINGTRKRQTNHKDITQNIIFVTDFHCALDLNVCQCQLIVAWL